MFELCVQERKTSIKINNTLIVDWFTTIEIIFVGVKGQQFDLYYP